MPSCEASLLAALVSAGALFYSALAPALGLGEISLHSALNQPLNADIELVDAEGIDRGDLAVGLASADEYSRAGIERVFFLNDLRFTPIFRGQRKFIHVSSVRPVVEPYLSFLVQVSRPGGQLLRDYTVLLDPAGTVALSPPSLPTGSAAADAGTDYTRAAANSAPPRAAPAKAAPTPNAALPPATLNQRYQVVAGDTLWTIGKKLNAAGTQTPANQLVRELRALNPRKAPLQPGQSLLLPDSAVLPDAGGVLPSVATDTDSDTDTAAAAAASSAMAPAGGSGTDTVAPATTAVSSAPSAPSAQSAEQLTAAALENQQLQQRLDEANARLQALEQQGLQRDRQLADLQARSPAPAVGVPPASTLVATAAPVAGSNPPAGQLAADSAAVVASPPPGVPPAPINAPRPDPAPGQAAVPVNAPASPAPVAAAADTSWLMVLGALSAILLLLALLLLARRRRQQHTANDPVLALTPVSPGAVVRPQPVEEPAARASTTPAVAPVAPVDPAPVAKPLTATNTRRDSVPATDALDGASIYIAYGRFNEALGILREGLGNQPNRTDLRLRMLEVLGQQGDSAGYDEQESALLAGGYSAPTLEQMRARYPKLAVSAAPAAASAQPNYTASGAAAGVIAAGVAAAQALQREPITPAEAVEQAGEAVVRADTPQSPASYAAGSELQDDEFPDLDSFDDLEELDRNSPPSAPRDEFQLNLDDLSLDADWDSVSPFDVPAPSKTNSASKAVVEEEIDLDFASNLKELPEVFEMQDEQFLSDFADPQLHVDLEPGTEVDAQSAGQHADQEELDNAFLDSFIADSDLPELDALSVDFDDLELQQLSAEKLERAQGCIDSGDFSQASELLLELLRDGDDASRHTARLLLSSIS